MQPVSLIKRLYRVALIVASTSFLCGISSADIVSYTSESSVLRIGTGGAAGTYFPIGALIAKAVNDSEQLRRSQNPEAAALLAVPQRSTGSQANVSDLRRGRLEAALAQADVVHWAYNAAGPFAERAPATELRVVATLYSESVHLVARKDSGIQGVEDLVGRRVSVDEPGSGTRLNVPYLLNAYGIDDSQLQTVFLKPVDAMDRLRRNQLDAFFIVAGFPVTGVESLVEDNIASVLPISGTGIESLLREFPFFTTYQIPENTYANSTAITTVAVPAQLVVDASLDEGQVYKLTELLWHDDTLSLLARGHPRGRDLHFDLALDGLSIPLHPGAERYYRNRAHAYFSQ